MRYDILDTQGNITSSIIADEAFMVAHYPRVVEFY